MKRILVLTIIIVIVMQMGCSSTYNLVSSKFDKSADFTKYKTFAWLPDKADSANTAYNNKIIRNNIRNYLGLCMSDRAYTFDRNKPDLLMQLVIKNAKKTTAANSYTDASYYSPYYAGSSYYSPYDDDYYYSDYTAYQIEYLDDGGDDDNVKQQYVNGAITINFIDRKTNKIIWSGTANGDIYDPSEIDHDLHPAVHKILDEYPVKPVLKRTHKIR